MEERISEFSILGKLRERNPVVRARNIRHEAAIIAKHVSGFSVQFGREIFQVGFSRTR